MMPSVVQRPSSPPQLITQRRVGKPNKDRAVQATGQVARKQSGDTAEKVPEQQISLYEMDTAEGSMRMNRYVPTGQYLDTYA